jgi:hypothetical protein
VNGPKTLIGSTKFPSGYNWMILSDTLFYPLFTPLFNSWQCYFWLVPKFHENTKNNVRKVKKITFFKKINPNSPAGLYFSCFQWKYLKEKFQFHIAKSIIVWIKIKAVLGWCLVIELSTNKLNFQEKKSKKTIWMDIECSLFCFGPPF